MKTRLNVHIIIYCIVIFFSSCNDYLNKINLPIDKISSEEVFKSDDMVATVATGVIIKAKDGIGIINSLFGPPGLYTDELEILSPFAAALPFYKNTIQEANSPYWQRYYSALINTNAAIEGINKTKAYLPNKNQWLGECYFIRAYTYFLLVNFYGAVPLALTTDHKVNNSLYRSSEEEVYKQIISDLLQAKELLPENYKNGVAQNTANRFRPNKSAAAALLARVYLYVKDWQKAELEATSVIENSFYILEPLDKVFKVGSKETILSFANTMSGLAYPYKHFNNGMPATLTANEGTNSKAVFIGMSKILYDSFDNSDLRKSVWIRKTVAAANSGRPETTFYFPNKYNSPVFDEELEIPLRLAEQYLIRAEARAHLQLSTAKDDLNVIRSRAGLSDINPIDIHAAIAKERQNELFTEGGHRFFDLKRTGKIDEVMQEVVKVKETKWESYMAYFPIPRQNYIQNPNIVPNPGYIQ